MHLPPAAFVLLLAAAHCASAATFSVTPVRIYMKPQDRAVAVTITNESDAPVLLRYESKAGHGQGKPTAKRIEEAADILSFLFMNLGAPAP